MFASLLLFCVLVLSVFLGFALVYQKTPEQRFETKYLGKLTSYQNKIRTLSAIVNDKYSELDYKLQCAKEAALCYAELKSFCYQSRDGKRWYQTACEKSEANTQEAVADFQKELSVLEKRKSEVMRTFPSNDWRFHWGDEIHSLAGQGARITRSYEEPIQVESFHPSARLALIRGASGQRYLTTPGFCSCPDFRKRELPCKHIYCLCRVTAAPDFSAPLKLPKGGLYGITACLTGKFHFGTQEDVRSVLESYHATVASSIESTDFILEGQQKVTSRAIQRATRLGLMQINEDELLPMLETQDQSGRK